MLLVVGRQIGAAAAEANAKRAAGNDHDFFPVDCCDHIEISLSVQDVAHGPAPISLVI